MLVPNKSIAVITAISLTSIIVAATAMELVHLRLVAAAEQCIYNLRRIDGAKVAWALQNHMGTNAMPTPEDIRPYLNGDAKMPRCPAGGTYVIGRVADYPTCSVPDHALKGPISVKVLAMLSASYEQGRSNGGSNNISNPGEAHNVARLRPRLIPTPAYRNKILQIMIDEANRIARDLNLPEQLPITRSNIIHIFIGPPGLFIHDSILGYVETTNYSYCCYVGWTLSEIDQMNEVKEFYESKARFTWPISRLDTNAAFGVATRIMESAGMDVASMNRDCKVSIIASMTEGPHGKHFVPDYEIDWQKPGTNVARLDFLQPTRSIRSLAVYDAKYILRKPVEAPDLIDLLGPENSREAVLKEWAITTNAAARRAFLIENHAPEFVFKKLGLTQTNAISPNELEK